MQHTASRNPHVNAPFFASSQVGAQGRKHSEAPSQGGNASSNLVGAAKTETPVQRGFLRVWRVISGRCVESLSQPSSASLHVFRSSLGIHAGDLGGDELFPGLGARMGEAGTNHHLARAAHHVA